MKIFAAGAFLITGCLGQVTSTSPDSNIYSNAKVTVGGPSTVGRRNSLQDHEKNLADLETLSAMVKQLREDLENAGPHTLPATAVKNADQVQKLAKKVHDRLKTK